MQEELFSVVKNISETIKSYEEGNEDNDNNTSIEKTDEK